MTAERDDEVSQWGVRADRVAAWTRQAAHQEGEERDGGDRLKADEQLVAYLAAHEFGGERYKGFEEALAAYGVAIMHGWLHSGKIFSLAADRHYFLRPNSDELDSLRRDATCRADLVHETVAAALRSFKRKALVEGSWRADGGATLTTYFMGFCVSAFPNVFRRYRKEQHRHSKEVSFEAPSALRNFRSERDPQDLWLEQEGLRELFQELDARTRRIFSLACQGYTHEEIAELLPEETSRRAIEGVLHRLRQKILKQRSREGGDPRGAA